MQEKLILYLHNDDLQQPSWAVVDQSGAVRQHAYRDNAEGLASIAENKLVIVIVPAEDVLLTTVKLPKMNRSRLAAALPFALEEQLIAEVETLHFVAGDYQQESLSVAIVAHAKMRAWLALLANWHIQPDKLIPASLALPNEEGTWHLAITENVIARTGAQQGFGGDINNLTELLDIVSTENKVAPRLIHIRNYSSTEIAIELDLPAKIKEEKIARADQIILDFAHAITDAVTLNLLQGPYAVKKNKPLERDKIWRVLVYLAATWIALLFLYPIVSYIILEKQVDQLNVQIAEIYQRHFPKSNHMVAPKSRMQDKLQKLDAKIGENRLLLLLGYLGKSLHASSNIKINRLDFQNKQLTLDLSAASAEDFSAFTNFLQQQGLTVKQQNATLVGARVNAILAIE